MNLGCCSTFGKGKNTLACGSSIFTLSESLATSLVHGSRNPARKTIRRSFSDFVQDQRGTYSRTGQEESLNSRTFQGLPRPYTPGNSRTKGLKRR
jgi:hypothetical protein